MIQILKHARVLVLLTIIAAAKSAPRRHRRSATPPWHRPCGEDIDVSTPPMVNFETEAADRLMAIRLQHKLTIRNYEDSSYEFLYENVRLGVEKQQYIPNWIPGRRDAKAVARIKTLNPETIANSLSKLHTDLQKFAVAFEELVKDERREKVSKALKMTQNALLGLLCEVETALVSLPPFQIPKRINKKIMSRVERNPVDETRRLVRDWGVLLKYKDNLNSWTEILNY